MSDSRVMRSTPGIAVASREIAPACTLPGEPGDCATQLVTTTDATPAARTYPIWGRRIGGVRRIRDNREGLRAIHCSHQRTERNKSCQCRRVSGKRDEAACRGSEHADKGEVGHPAIEVAPALVAARVVCKTCRMSHCSQSTSEALASRIARNAEPAVRSRSWGGRRLDRRRHVLDQSREGLQR